MQLCCLQKFLLSRLFCALVRLYEHYLSYFSDSLFRLRVVIRAKKNVAKGARTMRGGRTTQYTVLVFITGVMFITGVIIYIERKFTNPVKFLWLFHKSGFYWHSYWHSPKNLIYNRVMIVGWQIVPAVALESESDLRASWWNCCQVLYLLLPTYGW